MLKLATVFSGIGSVEHALEKLKIEYKVVFACDNGERVLDTERIDIEKKLKNLNDLEKKNYIDNLYNCTGKINYVQRTYMSNYPIKGKDYHQDVRFLDGNKYVGNIDLFVGGSPCQSFSISGKRLGLEDARGTLFYEYARLVKEIKPKVFIYENVPGMLSHDNKKTWKVISSIFDDLNYKWKLHKLNAKDFGIPQNRTRIFVVGIRDDLNIVPIDDIEPVVLNTTVSDYLEDKVESKYYHGEKGFKWITKEKSLKKRVSINSNIARTQAANQQFNWCGDMIFEEFRKENEYDDRIYIGEYKHVKGVARKLSPRECLRLMGYSDSFKIVVPDQQMYRQCGNSIVVNVMEAIINEIYKTGVFDNGK
ncbi:MAG: DNA cytosine methyltransferase [Longicatena sp.]